MSPPFALALGLCFGLLNANPWPERTAAWSKVMLRVCVVALGFGVNLQTVIEASRSSFLYTAIGIGLAMAIGLTLGKLMHVPQNTSLLIAAGTSICGGSAIAAVCPVLNANDDESAISLASVFVLNAIALFIFPVIGIWAHLSQTQFGLWAALAIHDTSSVVGAGMKYGALALSIATTVKLVRTIWIVPLTLFTALIVQKRAKVSWPWFILLFLAAAILRQVFTAEMPVWNTIANLSHAGFAMVLFLIGSGLSIGALKRLGWRPLATAAGLWLVVSVVSLVAIERGWIAV